MKTWKKSILTILVESIVLGFAMWVIDQTLLFNWFKGMNHPGLFIRLIILYCIALTAFLFKVLIWKNNRISYLVCLTSIMIQFLLQFLLRDAMESAYGFIADDAKVIGIQMIIWEIISVIFVLEITLGHQLFLKYIRKNDSFSIQRNKFIISLSVMSCITVISIITITLTNPTDNRLQDTEDPVRKITSQQVKKLTPDMTREEVIKQLGETEEIGSGVYIYVYEIDNEGFLHISFWGDDATLNMTGEELLKKLQKADKDKRESQD